MPNTLDHIFAKLTRLDLLLQREVLRLRDHSYQRLDDQFLGLYVSDEDTLKRKIFGFWQSVWRLWVMGNHQKKLL